MQLDFLTIFIHATIALITILNPVAAASIMVTLVSPLTPTTVKPIAVKTTLTVLIASMITLFSGEAIFNFFGINVNSIKVIGGIILMLIAINMAYGEMAKNRHSPEEKEEAQDKEDISVVPLGIPILFGPGVIATIIVLQHSIAVSYPIYIAYILLVVALLISSLMVYITLRYAIAITKWLGVTGIKILTRIMGLIVGAIAVQFIIDGIKALW
ncbi:multiple antibiotic resistance protein [Nitratiruptor sp. YY08-26]|uniref:MarC family protein n=1 Tax=unclassified Nitratiruptor TaxID=2624044 RepID=UPI001915867C|nr:MULTISPECIES: MarC family protein [unclassified Nitratiruptor]BCD63011.1 multiple antibiotic resistance protein [Nitratiruptor sp. YY08-13]BCD66946.1 multiple antibiotic resistance protein [Nitratiruptor sp. YY08-26]